MIEIEEVFRLMENYHVACRIHDLCPLKIPVRVTASTVYLRLHSDSTHGGDYSLATLRT